MWVSSQETKLLELHRQNNDSGAETLTSKHIQCINSDFLNFLLSFNVHSAKCRVLNCLLDGFLTNLYALVYKTLKIECFSTNRVSSLFFWSNLFPQRNCFDSLVYCFSFQCPATNICWQLSKWINEMQVGKNYQHWDFFFKWYAESVSLWWSIQPLILLVILLPCPNCKPCALKRKRNQLKE